MPQEYPNDIADVFKKCVVRIGNGSGCFISPNIGVTCAHVVTFQETTGEFFDVIVEGNVKLRAEILYINGDSNVDYCIFRIKDYSSYWHVILNDEGLQMREPVFGFGYSVSTDGIHFEGFTAKFDLSIQEVNTSHHWYKVGKGQIKRGFSGSPVVIERNMNCIGIVVDSGNVHFDLGGSVIPATILNDALRKIGGYNRSDDEYMRGKWLSVLNKKKDFPGKALSFPKRIDEIYTCNRDKFTGHFRDYFNVIVKNVEYYLIVGDENHSPLGLARKLIYENITKGNSAKVNYVCDPNNTECLVNPLRIHGGSSINTLLRDLYQICKIETGFTYYDKIDQKFIYEKMINCVKEFDITIFTIEIDFNVTRLEGDKIINLVGDFIKNFSIYGKNLECRVLFFWCVSHKRSYKNITNSIIIKFIKQLSMESLTPDRFASIDKYIPFLSKKKLAKLLEALSTRADNLHIRPVNKLDKLKIPPKSHIQKWMDDLDMNGASFYKIPTEDRSNLLKQKSTNSLQEGFLKIIMNYNRNLK